MTIAVIAGTPVDTQMGVELLNGKGVEALGFPVSRTPEEQTAFQVGSQSAREAAVVNHPRSSTGSGSQAPKKRQVPPHSASTQAWLSSQWAQRGV